jgi:hypothetical protein
MRGVEGKGEESLPWPDSRDMVNITHTVMSLRVVGVTVIDNGKAR